MKTMSKMLSLVGLTAVLSLTSCASEITLQEALDIIDSYDQAAVSEKYESGEVTGKAFVREATGIFEASFAAAGLEVGKEYKETFSVTPTCVTRNDLNLNLDDLVGAGGNLDFDDDFYTFYKVGSNGLRVVINVEEQTLTQPVISIKCEGEFNVNDEGLMTNMTMSADISMGETNTASVEMSYEYSYTLK